MIPLVFGFGLILDPNTFCKRISDVFHFLDESLDCSWLQRGCQSDHGGDGVLLPDLGQLNQRLADGFFLDEALRVSCCRIVNRVELGKEHLECLDHLLHLGCSGRVSHVVLSSDFPQSVILILEDLNLLSLLFDLARVDSDRLIQSLRLEFRVLDLSDSEGNALGVVFQVLFALSADLTPFVIRVDLFGLKIASQIIQEFAHSRETLISSQLQGDGL